MIQTNEKRFIKSDDDDIRPAITEVLLGGNGDYYIVVKELKDGLVTANSCRISTSGGANTLNVKIAVANLYRAVNNEIDLIEPKQEIDMKCAIYDCKNKKAKGTTKLCSKHHLEDCDNYFNNQCM